MDMDDDRVPGGVVGRRKYFATLNSLCAFFQSRKLNLLVPALAFAFKVGIFVYKLLCSFQILTELTVQLLCLAT